MRLVVVVLLSFLVVAVVVSVDATTASVSDRSPLLQEAVQLFDNVNDHRVALGFQPFPPAQVLLEEQLSDGEDNFLPGRQLLATRRVFYDPETQAAGELQGERFCDAGANGTTNCLAYGVWLGQGLLARLVVWILGLLFIPLFLCLRCCCNLCGGRKPVPGVCGACCSSEHDVEFNFYPMNHVVAVKVAIIIVTVACFGAFVAGYVGAGQVSTSIDDLLAAFVKFTDTIINRAVAAGDALSELEFTSSVDFGPVIQPVRDAQESLLAQTDTIDLYDGYRVIVINLALVVPFAFLFIGCVFGLVNFGACSIPIGMCILLVMTPLYFSAGTHGVLYTALGDLCVEIEAVLSGEENENAGAAQDLIDVLLQCADSGSSPFSELLNVAVDGLNSAGAAVCDGLSELCAFDDCGGSSSLSCAVAIATCNTTDTVLETNLCVTLPGSLGSYTTTVSECAETAEASSTVVSDPCAYGPMREAAIGLVLAVETLQEYRDVIDFSIAPLLNCTFVATFVEEVNTAICKTMLQGTGNIARGSDAMIAFLLFSVIVFILGAKRFISNESPLILTDETETPKLNKVAPADIDSDD